MAQRRKRKSRKGVNKIPIKIEETVAKKPTTRWAKWLPYIALFIVSTLLYFKSTKYGYNLDDTLVITDNAYVQQGFDGIDDIFTTESFKGYFGEQMDLLQGARYRPLSIASFALEQGLWGANTFRAHLINVILFGLCSIILYLVLITMLKIPPDKKWYLSIPFIAALLYALHPLHVEAVANIKGRDELMSFSLAFLSLFFAFRYLDRNKIIYLVWMSITFFLGLLAKENTITFLAVIPMSFFFFRKFKIKKLVLPVAVLLITTIIYLIIRVNIIGYLLSSGKEITDIMNNPFVGMDSPEKYATIFYTLGKYLQLNFFPHPLTHDYYPYHIPIMNWSKLGSLWPLIAHVGLFVIAIFGLRKKRIYSYLILFYLITLSIVSNLFVSIGTFMNERFMFLSSVAACLAIAYLVDWVSRKKGWYQYLSFVLLGLITIGFTVKSWTRIPAWENALSLNSTAIKVSKNSARANSFMSTALFNEAKTATTRESKLDIFTDAYHYADNAVRILPRYQNANLMKAGISAELYKLNNDQTQLLKDFKDVISRRPDVGFLTEFLRYLNGRSPNFKELSEFYYDAGYNLLHRTQGRNDWAIHFLKIGHALNASDPNINRALSIVYQTIGDNNNARKHQQLYEQSIQQQ